MCRICGSERDKTKDCCPTPLETGLAIPKDDFEKLMYEVWGDKGEVIPPSIVAGFYSDWMNGVPIDARTYLIQCGE